MTDGLLKDLSLDLIDRNPANPRIVFRPKEMSQLIESISRHGVQVPISVYREGKRYVLIDGERRWRCSIKLNRKTIPALVQDKPTKLKNLLLMFNIHALREQWDLLTIAMKLPEVIDLLRLQLEKDPNEKEISHETGLLISVIRRCKLLIDLPEKYKQTILRELQKPKSQQKLTEDFFIEMERALKTVERAMPDVLPERFKDSTRDRLIEKYKTNVINNVVHFRQLAKIARADRVGVDANSAKQAIIRIFREPGYSIEQAFNETVAYAYGERDLATRANTLVDFLNKFEIEELDDDARRALELLNSTLERFLGDDE